MKKILELYIELSESKIDKEEFFSKVFSATDILLDETYCIEQLEKTVVNKNPDTTDLFISIGLIIGFSNKAIPILCKLLLDDTHYHHENIASLLKEFKSPYSVEYLYKATGLRFDYLDYDDTYQFPRKCIKALAEIGDENAVQKLWLLSDSKNLTIAEYAKKELRYKHLL